MQPDPSLTHRHPAVKQTPRAASRQGKGGGPKTADGKRRVSRNAITHGLTCHDVVLPDDDHAEYATFRAKMIADWRPVGGDEQNCMEQMICYQWRMRHAWEATTNLYGISRDRLEQPRARLGWCMITDMQREGGFTKVMQIESTLHRLYHKSSQRLQDLQMLRRKGLRHMIDEDEDALYDVAAAPDAAIDAVEEEEVMAPEVDAEPVGATQELALEPSAPTDVEAQDASVPSEVTPEPVTEAVPTPEVSETAEATPADTSASDGNDGASGETPKQTSPAPHPLDVGRIVIPLPNRAER